MTVVEELVAVTLVLLGLSRRNESWVGGWVGVSIIIYTCPSALLFSSLIFNQAMVVVGDVLLHICHCLTLACFSSPPYSSLPSPPIALHLCLY